MKNKAFYIITTLVLALSLGAVYLYTPKDEEPASVETQPAATDNGLRIP